MDEKSEENRGTPIRSVSPWPEEVRHALQLLGRDLSLARRRRRIPQRLMAARIGVNVETLSRLEKGDPTVGIGTFATALWIFGMTNRLSGLLSPGQDTVAQAMDIERTPSHIHEDGTRDMDF